MVSKKLTIAVIISTIVLISGILVPGLLIASSSDSPSVTRLYADTLEGPWNTASSTTTRWVEKITLVNGQKTITIDEVSFMQEAPAGTMVFVIGSRGIIGPQGPQGPAGSSNGQILENGPE